MEKAYHQHPSITSQTLRGNDMGNKNRCQHGIEFYKNARCVRCEIVWETDRIKYHSVRLEDAENALRKLTNELKAASNNGLAHKEQQE